MSPHFVATDHNVNVTMKTPTRIKYLKSNGKLNLSSLKSEGLKQITVRVFDPRAFLHTPRAESKYTN